MIQEILNKYYDGMLSLEETLVKLEQRRTELEDELTFYKDFKDEKAEEVGSLAKEYPNGYKGYSFELRNGGAMYSFKGIEEWEEYKKQLKDCEDRYKGFLKSAMAGAEFGDEIQLPEISYRKSSVIIKKLKTQAA